MMDILGARVEHSILSSRMTRMNCHIWTFRGDLTFDAYQQDVSFIVYKALAADITNNWEEKENVRYPMVAKRMFLEDI